MPQKSLWILTSYSLDGKYTWGVKLEQVLRNTAKKPIINWFLRVEFI